MLEHLIPGSWRCRSGGALESEASEHGRDERRMDSATKKRQNEMIGRFRLQYNRATQASITKELMEIRSGAEAMK